MTILTKNFILLVTALSAVNASAALFDTLESVDTLKKVAATQQHDTDRMPASKEKPVPVKAAADEMKSAPAAADPAVNSAN